MLGSKRWTGPSEVMGRAVTAAPSPPRRGAKMRGIGWLAIEPQFDNGFSGGMAAGRRSVSLVFGRRNQRLISPGPYRLPKPPRVHRQQRGVEKKDGSEAKPDAVDDEGDIAGQCDCSQPDHALHAEGGEHKAGGEIAGPFERAHLGCSLRARSF